ncbi:hypothetical protein ACQRMG_001653 [Enterobacter hormaechei]
MECNVSELVKRGHDQVAELKSSCGAVDVRDVAQLISDLATQLDVQLARSNALSAENAGLKVACGGDGSYRDCPACAHSEYIEAPETPATDAFLVEVRAQGVEMFADSLLCPDLDDTIREFADELRKGVQS